MATISKTAASSAEFSFMLREIREKPPGAGEKLDEITARLALAVMRGKGGKRAPVLASSLTLNVLAAAGWEPGDGGAWSHTGP